MLGQKLLAWCLQPLTNLILVRMLMFYACKCDFLFLRTIQWLFMTLEQISNPFSLQVNTMAVPFLLVQLHLTQIYSQLHPITHTLYVPIHGISCLLLLTMISIGLKRICAPLSSFDYQSSSLLKFGQILSLLWCIQWIPNLYYQFLFCVSKTSCANLIRSITRNPFPYSQRIWVRRVHIA